MAELLEDLRGQVREAMGISYLIRQTDTDSWNLFMAREPLRVPDEREACLLRMNLPFLLTSVVNHFLLRVEGHGVAERTLMPSEQIDPEKAFVYLREFLERQFPFCFLEQEDDLIPRDISVTGLAANTKSTFCQMVVDSAGCPVLFPSEGVSNFMVDSSLLRASNYNGRGEFSWNKVDPVRAWEMYLVHNLTAQVNDWIIRRRISKWTSENNVNLITLNGIDIVMPIIGYCSVAKMEKIPDYVLNFINIFSTSSTRRVAMLFPEKVAWRLAVESGDERRRFYAFLEYSRKTLMYRQLVELGYIDYVGEIMELSGNEAAEVLSRSISAMHKALIERLGLRKNSVSEELIPYGKMLEELNDPRIFPIYPTEAQAAFYLSYLPETILIESLNSDDLFYKRFNTAMLLSLWLFQLVSRDSTLPYKPSFAEIVNDDWLRRVVGSLIIQRGTRSLEEGQDYLMRLKRSDLHQYALFMLERLMYMRSIFDKLERI